MAELVKKYLSSLTLEKLLDELVMIAEFASAFKVGSEVSMTREEDLAESKKFNEYAGEIKEFILTSYVKSKKVVSRETNSPPFL